MFDWNITEIPSRALGTIIGGVILAVVFWFWNRAKDATFRRRLSDRVQLAFEETDQYRRFSTIESDSAAFQRTFYVVGVINESGRTLDGVQCFVAEVDVNYLPDYHLPPKRPLQPVGEPKGAESIQIRQSVQGRPAAYFEMVEHFALSQSEQPDGESPWLCVTFGRSALPWACTIEISLEGNGFSKVERFSVTTRKPGPVFVPLTVSRVPNSDS